MSRRRLSCFLLSWTCISYGVALSVETRRSVLLPWRSERRDGGSAATAAGPLDDGCDAIGWVEERRNHHDKTFQLKVVWNGPGKDGGGDGDAACETLVHLPYIETAEGIASRLWPSGLAAAILCASPTLTEFLRGRSVLELGCGLAPAGLTVAQRGAGAVTLTDCDAAALTTLRETIDRRHHRSASTAVIRVAHLDWRDEPGDAAPAAERFPCVLGSDVAYYQHLLAPLRDAIRAHLCDATAVDDAAAVTAAAAGALLLCVGQANRAAQWALHRGLRDGGAYNPRTDEREKAWPGITETLLYRLRMDEWRAEDDDDDNNTAATVDGVVPIAALVHQTPGLMLPHLTVRDYAATDQDIEQMDMSF